MYYDFKLDLTHSYETGFYSYFLNLIILEVLWPILNFIELVNFINWLFKSLMWL